MIVWVYDRWGNQKDCIADLIDFAYDDEIGKIETIEFSTPGSPVTKGDYLVWCDEFGQWHEDIVASCEVIHQGSVIQHIYAEDSITELALSYIDERDSYNFENTVAMDRCLQGTRWRPITVNKLGVDSIKFYHTSVYDGIVDMLDKWGGEIETQKMVTSTGVYERRVNWLAKKGTDYGLIFYYGFDADQIERHVELDNIYTRVHVFGKGEEVYSEDGSTSGYGRRLTFADINGGRDYLEDNDAMKKWGIVNGAGEMAHAEGSVVFDQVEDEQKLLELGKTYLERVSKPKVTYTANIAVLADAGMDFKNARAGDTVYIRDEVLDERLQGRVMHVRRYLSANQPTEITLGNVIRMAPELWAEQVNQLQKVRDRESAWDDAANANSQWLKNLMQILNEDINATGGFVYWDYGEGITVYDLPIDMNPTMAIQLKGGAFRIANSKNSLGEWDWTTFGTGDGFTANLINVGVLRCGDNIINLDTGKIYLVDGQILDINGNYIDFGTGEWLLVNKDGKGMRFQNGELTIDADNVKIGAKNIQEWTEAQIEITGDTITSTVIDYTNERVSLVEQKADQIQATVGSVQENLQSQITQTAKDINATVSDLKTEVNSSITQTKNALEVSITDLASRVSVTCTCSTAAGTKAKVANLDPKEQTFKRTKGCVAIVTFTYTNTATQPTLNVANTGPAQIRAGAGNLPDQMTWAAGSTVIFTWTGSAWQLADSTTQNYINTHFLFDANGLTVMGSASSYKSRVGAGKFSILDTASKELMYIRSTGSGNNAKVELRTDNYGQIYLGTAMSSFTIQEGGFRLSSAYAGFMVNSVASTEAWRVSPSSATANSSANFSAVAFSYATLHAVDIYYTAASSGECRIIRVNFSGKSTAYATLTNFYANGNQWYSEIEKITLSRSGSNINITRTKPTRSYISGTTTSTNDNPGNIFTINYVAVCCYR